MAKIKKPQTARLSQGKIKSPDNASLGNTDRLPPIFSFYHLKKGQYDLESCEQHEKVALIETLVNLSQYSWLELKNAPRHAVGTEKIHHSAIKGVVIPSFIKEQDLTLLAFRFCAKAPIVGFRENQIFHILWIDRDFSLYNH